VSEIVFRAGSAMAALNLGATLDQMAEATLLAALDLEDEAMVASVHDAVRKGVCETCGVPASGQGEGVTDCGCARPIWRPASSEEQARAAISALRSMVLPNEPTPEEGKEGKGHE
jgi:hypothetical protein